MYLHYKAGQYLFCFLSVSAIVYAQGVCTADNCLRALRATSPTSRLAAATSFCSAFTQYTTTATTNIPAFAATACSTNAARISSACSCIPTPTPTACASLIQNGDFSQGPTQDYYNIPHWTTSCHSGDICPYDGYVEDFGGPKFWFKYEGNSGSGNAVATFFLEQSFTRCPGVTYNLTMKYYTDEFLPAGRPVTIGLQVGLYGSVEQTTTEIVLEYDSNCDDDGDDECENKYGPESDSGPLTVLVPPLSTVPALGDDGVRISVTYPLTAYQVEILISNVTLLATS